MKILDVPKSGRFRNVVAFRSRFGLCLREWVTPRNIVTPARDHMHAVFGSASQMWGGKLTQAQRDRWSLAGGEVMSHPRLAQRGPLTGEQFFTGINSVLGCVHLPPVWEPPARVVFNLSPVRQLVITNNEDGVRLFLRLAAAPTEDIMVFGQEPCSAGRNKRRNVSYLGLLPPPVGGLSEITDLYKARYGEPRPGRKVFIVTCQQKNGWKGLDQEASEVVPGWPEGQQVASEAAMRGVTRPADASLEGVAVLAETGTSQKALMHKGCTRGAEGFNTPAVRHSPEGAETGMHGGKAAVATLGESGGAGGGSGGPD